MPITINQQPVNYTSFPGGEIHVRLAALIKDDPVQVRADLHHANDIMALHLVIDALRRVQPNIVIDLVIPYFPYARQDRVCHPGEALSVQVMTQLINALQCHSVTIYDPHSDVTPALLHRCQVVPQASLVASSGLLRFICDQAIHIVSPDAGAVKKINALYHLAQQQQQYFELIQAGKERDSATGKITRSYFINKITPSDYIMIDDICDGGRTFIALAKQLKSQGANNLYLYVTHGIFSKGLAPLLPYFKYIFCFHLMNNAIDANEQKLIILEGETSCLPIH